MTNQTNRTKPVIAMDGPAASGKSTASRGLAKRLGFRVIDTGALYRGVALAALEQHIDTADAVAMTDLTKHISLAFSYDSDGTPRLLLSGRDVADQIRSPEVSLASAAVSKHPGLRAALLPIQRQFGAQGGVVVEGRDIGTVVFADADIKFFLEASAEVRAQRRHTEDTSRGAGPTLLSTTQAQLSARDHSDSTRAVAPLVMAQDAIKIDTSMLGAAEVVEQMVNIIAERLHIQGV